MDMDFLEIPDDVLYRRYGKYPLFIIYVRLVICKKHWYDLDYIAQDFTEDQIAEFREAFTLFAKDNDGRIQGQQLGSVLRSLNINPTEAYLKEKIRKIERNVTIEYFE
ncbi:hypothetical protein KUTeg_014092 [Tegillarca granosa]|uniref:EF-hand domain-containing protein n=1 Tax=Tegillarca granosa TaxID=220873 RepID=A0ABQ9EVN8_TEGGR|nr:hypothetical protein KUTeg_014092 [Tegillarca granosa]